MKSAAFAWSLLWPDKTVLSGDTPTAIIERLAQLQWEPCSAPQMRSRLIDRAEAWSGVIVREGGTDADLLRDLSAAGMFALMEPFNPIRKEV